MVLQIFMLKYMLKESATLPAYICVKWHIALYIVCNDIWYKSDCVIWCFSLCHM